jgi:hypothetical protein
MKKRSDYRFEYPGLLNQTLSLSDWMLELLQICYGGAGPQIHVKRCGKYEYKEDFRRDYRYHFGYQLFPSFGANPFQAIPFLQDLQVLFGCHKRWSSKLLLSFADSVDRLASLVEFDPKSFEENHPLAPVHQLVCNQCWYTRHKRVHLRNHDMQEIADALQVAAKQILY